MDDDPLLLGQRVVAILETGLRTATYKLATLMALIEHCIENLPNNLTTRCEYHYRRWHIECWKSTGNRFSHSMATSCASQQGRARRS